MSQSPDPMEEIRANFFVECEELIEALQDGLQVMMDGLQDDETINVVFRAVHSIKGGAGAFGLDPLVQFSHRFETLLDKMRSGVCLATQDCLKLCMRAADHLSSIIDGLQQAATAPLPNEMLNAALDKMVSSDLKSSEIADVSAIKTKPHVVGKKTNLRIGTQKSVVRVDLERIERLVNLVGELVINQSMLSQSLQHMGLPPHSGPMDDLEEYQRLTRDIQNSVMQIRAQPMKSLFQRMGRIVREVSEELHRDVHFEISGETTELDKTVIERLAEPLTHMIRNAIDHGLEASDQREKIGKPRQGHIALSAAHRSGRIIIELCDDGAGIDRQKVRKIATEKGLVSETAQFTDQDIDNLLFLPGFSTSDTISDLSGRGVGMDVVREVIHSLGGRITIKSVPKESTQFTISLPLTLAVMDGLIVDVAGQTVVIPLTSVVETLTLDQHSVDTLLGSQKVLRNHGFAPLTDLAAVLGYRPSVQCYSDMIAIFVKLEDGSHMAFAIDNILDQRQVVVKGLDDHIYCAPGVVAATILGDGKIALIVDPTDIPNSIERPIPLPPLDLATGT